MTFIHFGLRSRPPPNKKNKKSSQQLIKSDRNNLRLSKLLQIVVFVGLRFHAIPFWYCMDAIPLFAYNFFFFCNLHFYLSNIFCFFIFKGWDQKLTFLTFNLNHLKELHAQQPKYCMESQSVFVNYECNAFTTNSIC